MFRYLGTVSITSVIQTSTQKCHLHLRGGGTRKIVRNGQELCQQPLSSPYFLETAET